MTYYYAVSWTHCCHESFQICTYGITTSSIMTAVCFTPSTLLFSLHCRNWVCWLLSMRRAVSPKAQTTRFWRSCTVDMQWVQHAHMKAHLACSRTSERQIEWPISFHQNSLTTHLKELNIPLGRWIASCLWCSIELLCGGPTRPRATLTRKHWNVISPACRWKENSQSFLWLPDKKQLEVYKLRTAWPLPKVSVKLCKGYF